MRALRFLLAIAVATAEWGPTAAEANSDAAAEERAALAGLIDPLLAEQLRRTKLAGAVVVVVEHGVEVFAKGYGFADLAARRPMTVDSTLVHVGSISKLFTGLAVMQQVERRKLDLDRDVNDYLDFHVPTPTGVPVTLRRLLTHRAGFEEHGKNLFSTGPIPEPLGKWLARSLPHRLFPAGDVSAYSNYGVSLAGYVLERVTGVAFAPYMRDHVLHPFGMLHSTFEQPLPGTLAPLMAKSYRSTDQPPLPFLETIPAVPAGALAATGADMGRFISGLLALLTRDAQPPGVLDDHGGAPVISRAGMEQMLAPAIVSPTGFMGLTFFESKVEGVSFMGHEGGTLTFMSKLIFSPREQFGVFVSYDGDATGHDVVRAIVRHVFPKEVGAAAAATATNVAAPDAGDLAQAKASAARAAGAYQVSRRADTTFARFGALLGQQRFRAMGDGNLAWVKAVLPFGGGKLLSRDRRGHGLFRNDKGTALAFQDRPGEATRLYMGAPAQEWQRVPFYLDARVALPTAGISLLLAMLTLLAWPVSALFRRRRGLGALPPVERRARRLARAVLAVQALAVLAALILFVLSGHPEILSDALDPVVVALYALGWVGVIGAVAPVAVAAWFWWRRAGGAGGRWARLHHTAIGIAAVVLAWFLFTWRIAGTTLNY